MCDPRATANTGGRCYGARIASPTARTYDDGARGVRGQIVLAEDFRMVGAARQRGALRIPNAAFLISIHHPGRNVRRSPLNVEGSAKCGSLRALVWTSEPAAEICTGR